LSARRKELGGLDQALATLNEALVLAPAHPKALVARGEILEEMKRPAEALADYEKALAHDPAEPAIFSCVASASIRACDWSKAAQIKAGLERNVLESKPVTPFILMNYGSDASLALKCASTFVQDLLAAAGEPAWKGEAYRHDRIRLAYVSADFRQHPTAFLIAELIELHDRARFEVLGISTGPDDRSDIRGRLVKAFDEFHDVRAASDEEIARLIKAREIDITIDLMGFTTNSRTKIFALRPAPIQVNYLGYPGTMGAPFIDYIIGDKTVLPRDLQPFYSEKIVQLPDCYQVNDRHRRIADQAPARHETGLPESGFVFCCFNNTYKIMAPVFEVWMRLLRAVEGSVLWLLRDNPDAETNLRREARARGVDPARLVFAERAPLDQHLARHRLADLFLDTLPVNAHTTASDALWAGLPVVTCCGSNLSSRVAASLLRAVGLPELATHDLLQYEALALHLARDRSFLDDLRARLDGNRLTHPLFDTDRFRRHIEAAYTTMWETSQRGEPPRSFAVEAQPVGGHAPLHTGHPVISTRQIEARPSQTGRSEITGSSAGACHRAGRRPDPLADDDDREYGKRVAPLVEQAVALQQAGNLAQAEPLYLRILQVQPDHFDAQHMLGVLRHQQGRHAEALDLIGAACA
jgi:protein O-GlcNAc transferase